MTINKVVIIMGASSGIGEATANRLAEWGAKLVLAARRLDRLEAIQANHPEADIIVKQADVTDYAAVEEVVKTALDTFGRIDVLFNNAGIMPTAPLVDGRRDEWQAMLDVNVTGVLNGIAAVLPIMERQQSGHILATDSVAGHVVYPESAVYCGTKFAVRAIMEGLRQEQRENNVKSTIISPGAVQTELYNTISDKQAAKALHEAQTEWGLTSEDVAEAVVYAIDTPDRVSISDLVIRPTKQQV
ncbi:SDR family oxidoreductase [Exiguobacterium sp. SH1S21]|uniref:SDR family oxidoreductase n=1 Tax=Exiguobacterium sp. SH1S21 TaxID=2510953 RepID=UPI00103AA9C9|nr:SDR family oxidoreductase [Exiguobacterium sp. SH1S21]TCI57489.1 SDR family oxidoreductase [Exiguobacterium sp. SH1S21]